MILPSILTETRAAVNLAAAYIKREIVKVTGAYYESMLNPWDVAAGILIVREAGGKVSDYNGVEKGYSGKETMAAAPQFYDIVKKVLNR